MSEDEKTNSDETNSVETNQSETNDAETNAADESSDQANVVAAPAPASPQPQQIAAPAPPPMPIVVCHSVTARDTAGPRRRSRGTLNGLSFSLGKGIFAFVGAPEDGTLALTDALSGARTPVRGRIQVMGAQPDRSSSLRLRMGVLSPEPALPAARSVAEVMAIALQARGQTRTTPLEILSSLGLEHLAPRSPKSLSFAETRAVELALALSTPNPLLVVLHEPLADVAINLLGVVRERIHQLGAAGACVVVTTSSPSDARSLADEVFALHRGALVREVMAAQSPLLVAWVRPGEHTEGQTSIRRLAQALTMHPEISSVTWTEHTESRAAELRLSGTDLDACALALSDAASEVGAIVEAIAPASPGLTRLRAAAEAAEALKRASTSPRQVGAPAVNQGGSR